MPAVAVQPSSSLAAQHAIAKVEPVLTVGVYNANLKHWPDATGFAERVRNIARRASEKDNQRARPADLFGLVEAHYETEGWWTEHHVPKVVPCPEPAGTMNKWTHHCFFDRWLEALAPALRGPSNMTLGAMGHQHGDVSLLASRDAFDVVPGTDYFTGVIGPGGFGRLQYRIVGVRLRHKPTGKVLPFYVVHVVTGAGSDGRRRECVDDIVEFVKSHWVTGDLTPVVVGDFNFGRTGDVESELYLKMSTHFREAGWICGRDDIEHTWIGKDSSFGGSGGALWPVAFDPGTEFQEKPVVALTDHNIPYVELGLFPESISGGTVGAMIQNLDWSSGWTAAETYAAGDSEFLFLLKEGTGAVHIHRLGADGLIGARVQTHDWSNGWTTVAPYSFSGSTFLLLLKQESGAVHVHRINPDGTVGVMVQEADWSSGWTTATFFATGGGTYLLLLKKSDGVAHIHRVNGDGTIGDRVGTYDWSRGWTSATSYSVGGNTYLLLLKADDGLVHVHRMNADGTVGDLVDEYDWSDGWTTARSYSTAAGVYLLLMKRDEGKVHVHWINSNGTIGSQTASYDWSSGWTSASFFGAPAAKRLLLLKQSNGIVHVNELN